MRPIDETIEKINTLLGESEKKFSKTIKDPKTGRTRTIRYGEKGSEIRPGTEKGDS
jgi:hypothetical protein